MAISHSFKKPIQTAQLIEKGLIMSNQHFKDRNVSIKKAVYILAQNNIDVDEDEATIILDFLYLVAKFCKRPEDKMTPNTISKNRTAKMSLKSLIIH